MITQEAAISLVKQTTLIGLVKEGEVIAISKALEPGLSHAQLAGKIEMKLVNGRLPAGVEGFVANGAGSIIGGGINAMIPGGYPVISAAARAAVKVFFKF